MTFSSVGSPNEYANDCSSVGSVSYANKITSSSYSSNALELYVTNCLANDPATFHSRHQWTKIPLRCKLATYEQHIWAVQISASHTLKLHGPLLLIGSKFGWDTGGAPTTNYMHSFYIRLLYHSHRNGLRHVSLSCHVVWGLKAMGINYRRRLKKKYSFSFCLRFLGEPSVFEEMGQGC